MGVEEEDKIARGLAKDASHLQLGGHWPRLLCGLGSPLSACSSLAGILPITLGTVE